MPCCCYWIQGHQYDWQCLWFVHLSSHLYLFRFLYLYLDCFCVVCMYICVCVLIPMLFSTGLAVITVMFITTCLMFLIISTVWKQNVFLSFLFVLIFGSLELLYLSACLAKVHRGGWHPILLSLIILSIMSSWHYGTAKKNGFELQNKVSLDSLLNLGLGLEIKRVPGISLIYSNISSGIPPMFSHFVANFPAFHKILIFVNLHFVMVPKISAGERFLVARIGLPEFRMFGCIVRYTFPSFPFHFY